LKVINRTVPNDFNLFLFSDTHIGSLLFHEDGFNQFVDMIRSPYGGLPAKRNYAAFLGDEIEAILVDDPRFDQNTTEGNVLDQINLTKAMFKPIADKILVWMDGNHPLKLWKFGNITEEICKFLEIEHGTYQCVVRFQNKKNKPLFNALLAHGYGAINSTIDDPRDRENSMLRSLRRKLQRKMGDCILMAMGHCHKLLQYKPKAELYINAGEEKVHQAFTEPTHTGTYLDPALRWYLAVGAFLRTYGDGVSGYAERFGYDPLVIGWQVCRIRGGEIEDIDMVVVDS